MSGHSKWATTKRHKAAIDAKRGKLFSIYGKEITIAARAGGGDPEFNSRLRTVINNAKAANMPADNIERAIKKGTGELGGVEILQLLYEGYGPGGVGFIVQVTTDNKNRSASEVRSTFSKAGGNLAGAGALAYNFQHKGQFLIDAEKVNEERLFEVALLAGAEDIQVEEDHFEVLCAVNDFDKIAKAFEDNKISCEAAELVYIPNTTVAVTDPEMAKKVLQLFQKLEDLEDVKSVHTNFDIDPSLLTEE